MAAGKNPFLRYAIIDHCLSSKQHRYWTAEELMEKFSKYDLIVEMRSLMYDLRNMREDSQLNYNAPIAYCRKNKGYHYTDQNYTINGSHLSDSDLMSLAFVVAVSEQFEGTDVLQQAKGTLSKLSKTNHRLLMPGSSSYRHVVQAEPKPYYKGLRFLTVLTTSIFQRQSLRIGYRKFQDEHDTEHLFHPYQLKTYNNRWYVRGYSEKRKDVIILGLERIESVQEEKMRFRDDEAVDDSEYFSNTIGISKGNGKVEDIDLEFTPEQGHYIKTLHLHHSQQIIKDDKKSLIIRLRLVQNYELYQLILSYMNQVIVLGPPSLRNHIKETLLKLEALYSKED